MYEVARGRQAGGGRVGYRLDRRRLHCRGLHCRGDRLGDGCRRGGREGHGRRATQCEIRHLQNDLNTQVVFRVFGFRRRSRIGLVQGVGRWNDSPQGPRRLGGRSRRRGRSRWTRGAGEQWLSCHKGIQSRVVDRTAPLPGLSHLSAPITQVLSFAATLPSERSWMGQKWELPRTPLRRTVSELYDWGPEWGRRLGKLLRSSAERPTEFGNLWP